MQMVKMLEMPVAQMEDYVRQEIDANPSLEPDYSDTVGEGMMQADAADTAYPADSAAADERERRSDALNDALDRIGQDDRMDNTTFSDYCTTRQGSHEIGRAHV